MLGAHNDLNRRMSASTHVSVPSFARQLGSMINFVQFCQQEQAPTIDSLRQSWSNVEKNVITPNGLAVDSPVIPDIPDDTRVMDSYVSDVCTLARGIFDPRVEQFNRTDLTPTIVLSQGLHRKQLLEQAVNMRCTRGFDAGICAQGEALDNGYRRMDYAGKFFCCGGPRRHREHYLWTYPEGSRPCTFIGCCCRS